MTTRRNMTAPGAPAPTDQEWADLQPTGNVVAYLLVSDLVTLLALVALAVAYG